MKQNILYAILSIIGILVTTACSSANTSQQTAIEPIQTETMTANEPIQTTNSQIVTIATGTYFGECFGYCNDTMIVNRDKIRYVKTSNVHDDSYPDLGSEADIDIDTWDEFVNSIDFEKFSKLPDTIGCPDCNDQGGEWIEIKRGKITHRVDIELGASVPEIDNLLAKLRKLRETVAEQHKR